MLQKENIRIILYIFLAFLFGVGIRMIWVYQFKDFSSLFWNGQLMINTNDGYYFAEGARDYLAGFHQPNDISPINHPVSILTAYLAKILPFSFESIILFMPAVLGSLIVVPIVLIGKSLKNLELGFIAALLACITWSYYNRTMTGYFDTDMLNIVFPTFILWALMVSVQSQKLKYPICLALFEILYIWWYPQAYAIEFAFFGLVLFYTLIFDLKNVYMHKIIIIMLFSMINLPLNIKLALIILLFILFTTIKNNKNLILGGIFLAGIVIFFATGGFAPIWGSLKSYVIREAINDSGENIKLHFYNVAQTVREAGHISFETFANRISGNVVTFFASLAGFIWLCFRHRILLLSLPMLGLGFLAYSGGLRFTVYAVPVLAFGAGYLILKLSENFENKYAKYSLIVGLTIATLVPNIIHIYHYKVPTVFNNQEVKVIDYLKRHASREDYVISWWDYGYPLRYYGDVKTLVDGGKHSGEVNFVPSFVLTAPQEEAARMARLEVEYTEAGYKDKNLTSSTMAKMMKDFGYKNANDFLLSLDDIKLPKKTRDIYLYLPFRMMGIYPTVAKFSYIDLMSGKLKAQPFLYQAVGAKDTKEFMYLGNGISLDKKTSLVKIGDGKYPLKSVYILENTKNGVHVKVDNVRKKGYVNLVFARSYNAIYLMDDKALNSTYVQLFLFQNYNKNLFEPVLLNPYAKLYKLKE